MTSNNIKRIVIILTIISISVLYTSEIRKNRQIGEATQVTSLPVSGKVVILDAGHGTPDERSRK